MNKTKLLVQLRVFMVATIAAAIIVGCAGLSPDGAEESQAPQQGGKSTAIAPVAVLALRRNRNSICSW